MRGDALGRELLILVDEALPVKVPAKTFEVPVCRLIVVPDCAPVVDPGDTLLVNLCLAIALITRRASSVVIRLSPVTSK